MKKKMILFLMLVLLIGAMSTTAFAIDESEVESAIAASSQEEVAGNVFIWFLCAIGFLKISQKIDSFMASLGVNVGRTGGSMLAELMVAGRGIAAAAGAVSGTVFNRNSSHSSQSGGQAAGAAFTGGGNSIVGITKRAAGNAAAASATGTGTGLSNLVGGAMFNSSLKSGGQFATSVIGAVAKGNMSTVGSITGEQASEALSSYMGYSAVAANELNVEDGVAVPMAPVVSEDVITLDGGTAAGSVPPATQTVQSNATSTPIAAAPSGATPTSAKNVSGVVQSPGAAEQGVQVAAAPVFRNVEIGGGRITGQEVSADGQSEREFAMYSAEQYMTPTGPYDTVQTVDGSSWYRQYAQPTVEKTPYKDGDDKIKYEERIVPQMPPVPKRKDKI